jgi:hypothetical protein
MSRVKLAPPNANAIAVQTLATLAGPVMQGRLFRESQHQLISYDNEFTARWRLGFDWKQWP